MDKRIFKITLYFSLFIISNSAVSQQQEYIIGKLIDAKTQEPVAFASIRIKDRALGIISNTDGSFKIPLKYKDYGDVIEISSMGYQTKEILLRDFSVYVLNNVRLQPAVLELEEAVLIGKRKTKKKLSAKKIVQKAIDAILKNYPITPFSQVGYYRDYQLDNGEYVNLNEAILEVFDLGFKTIDTSRTKTRIYDYVQNEKFKRDTLSDNPYDYKRGSKIIVNAYIPDYGGNEFSTLKVHDAIRNYQLTSYDFIGSIKEGDILNSHYFKKVSHTYLNDKPLYVIPFERNQDEYLAKGIIYISKIDYAIHKLEYAVYDNSKINKNDKLKNSGVKGKLIIDVTTEYKRNENDKLYLNYISFHNTFQLRQPPKLKLEYLDLRFGENQLDKGWIILTFSKNLNLKYAENLNNYTVRFKGEKIKFKGMLISDNQVILYPKLQTDRQKEVLNKLELIAREDGLNKGVLKVEVRNIIDLDGNLIDEQALKEYNQFREFFVQKVNLLPKAPIDSLFMYNRKPIFKDQPILKPDNFNDYWMNTPLQTIKN